MAAIPIHNDGDAQDREYGSYRQDLVDAFAEGKRAGIEEQRVEMNPYLRIDAMHEQWLAGWREGVARTITKRRSE